MDNIHKLFLDMLYFKVQKGDWFGLRRIAGELSRFVNEEDLLDLFSLDLEEYAHHMKEEAYK